MKHNERLENLVQQLYVSEKLPRSLFARFEKLFPDIEDEFRKGFSHEEIYTTLIGTGMKISMNTYQAFQINPAVMTSRWEAPRIFKE